MPSPHHEIRHGQLQLTPTFSPCVIGPAKGAHVAGFRHERIPLCRRTQPHPFISLSPDSIQECITRSVPIRFCQQYSGWHVDAPVLSYQEYYERQGMSPSPDERGSVLLCRAWSPMGDTVGGCQISGVQHLWAWKFSTLESSSG